MNTLNDFYHFKEYTQTNWSDQGKSNTNTLVDLNEVITESLLPFSKMMLNMSYQSVVMSAVFYAVVYWNSGVIAEANRLDKLIWRAVSTLGFSLTVHWERQQDTCSTPLAIMVSAVQIKQPSATDWSCFDAWLGVSEVPSVAAIRLFNTLLDCLNTI